jgi:hypothetical protein
VAVGFYSSKSRLELKKTAVLSGQRKVVECPHLCLDHALASPLSQPTLRSEISDDNHAVAISISPCTWLIICELTP